MALNPFRRIRTQQKDVQMLQDAVARPFLDILRVEILDGRLIEGVEITTAGVQVEHKLGRTLRGWWVTDLNAGALVWRSNKDNPTIWLSLDASATVTVSLWVF